MYIVYHKAWPSRNKNEDTKKKKKRKSSTVTSCAQPHDWPPLPDLVGPQPDLPDFGTSIRTFCSTYLLLTHSLHVTFGPHSGLRLPPDIRSTLLHHPVYPSTLLTLFVFTRLQLFPYTRLQLLSLLTRLWPDLLSGPATLVYKSTLLYTRSSVLISC